MKYKLHLLTIMAGLVVLLLATGAQAHAHLVTAMPAADSHATSPKTIMLHFNEKLEAKLSGFELTAADGTAIATNPVMINGLMMTAALTAPLAVGTYTVNWHAVTADGHRMTGTYAFTVK